MDSVIVRKNNKEGVKGVTQETFGNYPQPRLEFSQNKLEIKFKMT